VFQRKHKKWRENNKEIVKKYNTEYRKNNKAKYKILYKIHNLKKYSLTIENLEEMKIKQNNKCAICGEEFKKSKNIHVDHCHITGKVRGLLCNKCNTGLGFLHDNIDVLKNAINYLERSNINEHILQS
jgi:hypothetical protein